MPLYESVIICRQDITKNQLDQIISDFKDHLISEKGNILHEEYWGLRNLAYPIKENKKAFYEFMNIELPQDKIDTLNSRLNLNDKIIRYLSIKVKDFCDTPTIMVKSKD